jgi:hypothetical protein
MANPFVHIELNTDNVAEESDAWISERFLRWELL